MDETPNCEQVRPLLAELALTAVTGYDRAQSLQHVGTCPRCRRELAELARIADDLLLLAPEAEPPAGFESAVMERIARLAAGDTARQRSGAPRPRSLTSRARRYAATLTAARLPRARRRLGRIAVALTIAVLAATAGAGTVLWRTAPDRHLADQYRRTHATTNGRYPTTASITTDTGTPVGHVFLIQGAPPWILVSISAAPAPGDYTMSVVSVDGTRYPAGVCQVTGQSGTTGYPLPIPVPQIASIDLTRPGVRLEVRW